MLRGASSGETFQTTHSLNAVKNSRTSLEIPLKKIQKIANFFDDAESREVTNIPKLLAECDSIEQLQEILSYLNDTYTQVFEKTRSPEGTTLQN